MGYPAQCVAVIGLPGVDKSTLLRALDSGLPSYKCSARQAPTADLRASVGACFQLWMGALRHAATNDQSVVVESTLEFEAALVRHECASAAQAT